MGVVNAAEKPPQGDFFGNRRMRRRKRALTHYRIKEKSLRRRRTASGPHVDYNARLYDPALGRFLSVDPLIAHPGSAQSINPYSYVENNPLNKTDPTGMAASCVGGQGAGCDVSLKDSSVTVNPNKGTVTVNHANGTSQTVSVGKGAANAMSAGAQAMFGASVVQRGQNSSLGNTGSKNHDPSTISTHMVNPTKAASKDDDADNGALGKAIKYSLIHGLKESNAKGTYWKGIYDGKREGTAKEWGKISAAATQMMKFTGRANMSDSDFRMFFNLRSDVSAEQLSEDRMLVTTSLLAISSTAMKNVIWIDAGRAADITAEVIGNKGLGLMTRGLGEAAERALTTSDLAQRAFERLQMSRSRRIGPIITCQPDNGCGLAN